MPYVKDKSGKKIFVRKKRNNWDNLDLLEGHFDGIDLLEDKNTIKNLVLNRVSAVENESSSLQPKPKVSQKKKIKRKINSNLLDDHDDLDTILKSTAATTQKKGTSLGKTKKQYSDEPIDNQLTTNKQSINNQLTTDAEITLNDEPIDNQLTINKQSINNQLTINKQPIDNQLTTNSALIEYTIAKLGDQQKTYLSFIICECMKTDNLISTPLNSNIISSFTGIPSRNIGGLNISLIKKNLLKIMQSTRGKGGFIIFSVSKEIADLFKNKPFLFDNQLTTNKQLIDNQLTTNKQLGSYSSSAFINKETTTTTTFNNMNVKQNFLENLEIPESLEKLSLNPENLYRTLFVKKKLSFEIVQDSLYKLDFSIRNCNWQEEVLNKISENKKKAFIFGCFPFEASINYLPPEEEKLKKYLESEKKVKERINKLNQELMETEFEKWFKGLSEEEQLSYVEKQELLPKMRRPRLQALKVECKNHFEEVVFPEIKAKILSGN